MEAQRQEDLRVRHPQQFIDFRLHDSGLFPSRRSMPDENQIHGSFWKSSLPCTSLQLQCEPSWLRAHAELRMHIRTPTPKYANAIGKFGQYRFATAAIRGAHSACRRKRRKYKHRVEQSEGLLRHTPSESITSHAVGTHATNVRARGGGFAVSGKGDEEGKGKD